MAIVTGVAAGDVGRVLAGGNDTVMTGTTGAEHLGVIHRVGGYPQGVVVAVLTNFARTDVCQRLASGLNAIVTAQAVVGDTGMVKRCRDPAGT